MEYLSFEEVKRRQRARRQQLPDADGREKESPGTGEEMTEIDMTGITATHRGGGYYEVRNGSGDVVAESVSKTEAREMGAEV